MAARPRIYTIPPSADFLGVLVDALTSGKLFAYFPTPGDPLSLASATIYLPTRRACRLARDAFLQRGGVTMLPRLIAIGDVDEDELIFAEVASGAATLEIPPAIEPLERRFLLTSLVAMWASSRDLQQGPEAGLVANTPAAALDLADALARLIDDMITRGVDWKRLDDLVPGEHDKYWELTLRFLKIAREVWPQHLREAGLTEIAERRDLLIEAEAKRLASATNGPVIAAGSTASMPSTARLLAAIARLPHGAVVLPGLDKRLDAESWSKIGGQAPTFADASVAHPQYGMFGFLRLVGIDRDEVWELGETLLPERESLLSEAMRPASATEQWAALAGRADMALGLEGIALIEAETIEEEALALAVALREAVETLGRTAALVTPDRALARRVVAALARWGVPVDDSGGDALVDDAGGVFARLAAEVALRGADPVSLLALLKHAHLRLGREAGGYRGAVAVLELGVLRGPRPARGTAGLAQALKLLREGRGALHRLDPRRALTDKKLDAADAVIAALTKALAPLENLGEKLPSLAQLAQWHRDVLAALTQGVVPTAEDDPIDDALAEIAESDSAAALRLDVEDYPDFIEQALAGKVVRTRPNADARVRVFGLLEARLQNVDRIVLGAMIEGTWPPQTRSDPWLSRPMRHALGLDLPERRIGLTAHDFAQALGTRDVVLSRSAKVGGAPTVPSRFLQRVAAVSGEEPWKAALARGEKYRAWARTLDTPDAQIFIPEPLPTPPRDARPTHFSVTEIETWLRDPYSIYAKRILKLNKLDPVDTPPGARDRGSAVHAAIEKFTELHAETLPPDPYATLIELGREAFRPLAAHPDAQAFWWPRFERVARWFAEWERARRLDVATVLPEARGAIKFDIGERTFTLTARADRIERRQDGSLALLDYKTGQIATGPQVLSGLAPQLTLEAAIVQAGGFEKIPAGAAIAALTYVQLRGGEPPGFVRELAEEDAWRRAGTTPDAEAAKALGKLKTLLERFENEAEGYRALWRPQFRQRYGDYDLLARVKEWSATGGAVDEEAPR